jgi:hypothetical protein
MKDRSHRTWGAHRADYERDAYLARPFAPEAHQSNRKLWRSADRPEGRDLYGHGAIASCRVGEGTGDRALVMVPTRTSRKTTSSWYKFGTPLQKPLRYS